MGKKKKTNSAFGLVGHVISSKQGTTPTDDDTNDSILDKGHQKKDGKIKKDKRGRNEKKLLVLHNRKTKREVCAERKGEVER